MQKLNARSLLLLWGVLLLFSALSRSTASAQDPVVAPPAPAPTENKPTADASQRSAAPMPGSSGVVKIMPGDLVEISVYGSSDMNSRSRISPAGDMYLPLVGTIHLAGLSVEQAQAEIEKKLLEGDILKNPHVSLSVAETGAAVSVLGEVARPGMISILGPRSLMEVISMAGGLTPRAGSLATITRRDKPGEPINVNLLLTQDANDSKLEINPGDSVVVTRAGLVYVVGDVAHPSGLMIDNVSGMTVLQAIALAQGANKTAALSKAAVIRKGPNGTREQIPLDLKRIMTAKATDVPLQDNDVLFVPASAGKITTKAILSNLGTVAILATTF